MSSTPSASTPTAPTTTTTRSTALRTPSRHAHLHCDQGAFGAGDGSLIAKQGGCGWYLERHARRRGTWPQRQWRASEQHMGPFASHDICLLEICAVWLSLGIISDASADFLRNIKAVYCICDNQPVVGWLAGTTHDAQHPFIISLIRNIYTIICALFDKHNITVSIQWCRRGIWFGNKMADAEAKKSVNAASTPTPSAYQGTSHRAIVTSIKQQQRDQLRSRITCSRASYSPGSSTQIPTSDPRTIIKC